MNNKYTKEELTKIVKKNYSIAECLRKLNLRPSGGNYKKFNNLVKIFEIDTSHFTGQGWSFGKSIGVSNRAKKLNEILIKNSTFSSSNHLKKRLIKEKLKAHICEKCKNSIWNNKPIPLELEHVNGNNTDNRIENLKLLCPNCHAQTPFYRGKNKRSSLNERRELNRVKFGETLTVKADGNPEPSSKKREGVETLRREPKLCSCGQQIHKNSKKCRDCDYLARKSNRPSPIQLIQDFQELKSFVKVGKKYGVSDNSVRKWLVLYKMNNNMVKRKSSAQT